MPEINYSVRIVDEDGNGVSGKRVSVHYQMTHDSDYTDGDGWVEFTKDNLINPIESAEVYVDGDPQRSISIRDGDTFSFTI